MFSIYKTFTHQFRYFSDGELWVKKDDEDDFDVPMGCYNEAEVCELVFTYLPIQSKVVITKENMALYRNDGLEIFKNFCETEVERKKKELVKTFKSNGVTITVKNNLKAADFLDMHFDLVKEIYLLHKKPTDDALCIDKKFNHPPS